MAAKMRVPDMANEGPEAVDLILEGGTVLTMDAERRVFAPGAVAVRGTRIAAVGPVEDVRRTHRAREAICCEGQVILPGLINTHSHLPMSILRGLADDLRLDVWLYGYILPVERKFVNPEFCFLGATLSCAEMLRGGTTCFVDMYYFEEEVAWAAEQAGMRGVCGETIVKVPAPDATSFEDSLAYCADFLSRWRGHELIVPVPAPHSLYMTTPEILRETTALARQYNVSQCMHISETVEEVEQWEATTGMRPVRFLEERGMLDGPLLAAHCVHVNEEEIRILARHRTGIAHNPTSNLKLASGVAPVAKMLDAGIAVGVGTDGCASNNDLDMFEEVRLAALLSKGITYNPVALPAEEAVAMATIYGARALGLDHLIGSLEPNKCADIIVVDMQRLHNLPPYETTGRNVYSRLVYASHAEDVRYVLVNGRQVVRDGALQTVDERRVTDQVLNISERINKYFVAHESNVLDKLVSIGGLQQQETFEVQGKGVVRDEALFRQGLANSSLHVTGHTSRNQYDTYFIFDDPEQGRLRYREDNIVEPDGSVRPIYSLTLTGPAREAEYQNSVVLSRSRFAAPADRSLRFYCEYFRPVRQVEIIKQRERYHVRYQGLDFAVNLDRIVKPPAQDLYVEIKSRTWSQQDALRKAAMIGDMLGILGVRPEDVIRDEYVDLFGKAE